MKAGTYLRYSGIAFLIAGGVVVLALTAWWVKTGFWIGLSLVDAVAFVSPAVAANVTVTVSDSDVFYFILCEMPLYALLMTLGVASMAVAPGRRAGSSGSFQ